MRLRLTIDPGAAKYFKWGDLIQLGDSDPLVFKRVKHGQMVVVKPFLNEKQRDAMRGIIRCLDWPNRHIFRPIEWWIWERRNAVFIKGFRLVIDEVMRRRRIAKLEGRKGK